MQGWKRGPSLVALDVSDGNVVTSCSRSLVYSCNQCHVSIASRAKIILTIKRESLELERDMTKRTMLPGPSCGHSILAKKRGPE